MFIEDYYPLQTEQGTVYVSESHLGADPVAAASAAASVGSKLAASLVAAGVGTQAIPVIGQVLGGLALVGGFIASARAKAKATKEQSAQIDTATIELLKQSSELDSMLRQSQQSVDAINNEIQKLGLQGLSGFTDWLKQTFTPNQYAQSVVNDKTENYNTLVQQVEQKINALQAIEAHLKNLYEKLTGGKNLQSTLLIGGSIAVGLAVLYFLNEEYKWFKF